MIKYIKDLTPFMDFINDVNADLDCSEPMLSTEDQMEVNLKKSLNKPNDHVLGVWEDGVFTGLFDFLVLEEERYIEMIVGLTRSQTAWEEIFAWLKRGYPGFQADFVFNPRNTRLRELLDQKGAEYEPEQEKLVLGEDLPVFDTTGIEPLNENYLDQYLAMHNTDMYWTGDKVWEAKERFRTLLAVEDGAVLGYVDVTICFAENEVYDLWVKPEYRRRGWGRKLMARAIELNRPKGMMLLQDVGNYAANGLYRSVGFHIAEGANSVTATWMIPAENS